MVIELALLIAVAAAMGDTIVRVYEWRQDVLYGRDRAKARVEPNRRR
jgi:hypothetical protein